MILITMMRTTLKLIYQLIYHCHCKRIKVWVHIVLESRRNDTRIVIPQSDTEHLLLQAARSLHRASEKKGLLIACSGPRSHGPGGTGLCHVSAAAPLLVLGYPFLSRSKSLDLDYFYEDLQSRQYPMAAL